MPYIKMHRMNDILLIIGFVAAGLSGSKALAWGSVGHRTTGYVAEQYLLPSVKTQLKDILGKESLADVANWADSLKQDQTWKHASWYHFENIDDNETYLESLEAMTEERLAKGGTLAAILKAEQTFLNARASKIDKANALKFIVHLVGDIHQPLHTGRPDDQGGNKVEMSWNGTDTNLHTVWDVFVIQDGHGQIFSMASASEWPEQKYATGLIAEFGKLPVNKTALGDPAAWVHESMALRDGAYQYMNESEKAYTRRFLKTVDQRVFMAGLRIAGMVNSLVSKANPPATRVDLKTSIEKIAGALTDYITLKPRSNRPQQLDSTWVGTISDVQ